MKIYEIILAIATILSALMSGFFFAYSFSVNSGLHILDNKAYLMAMQNINKEVLNFVFYICFFGTLILLVALSILYLDFRSQKFYLIFIACISYTIGVFMVTSIGNVPLNNSLAEFDISHASETSLKNMRSIFEDAWVFWNSFRALASFITSVCLITSLFFYNSIPKSYQNLDKV